MWAKLRPFTSRLGRHKGLKALALLMAVISWYMINDAISFEVVIPEIRLQIQTPPGLAILNQSASTVDVTFRGSQDDLARLDPRQIYAVLEVPVRAGSVPEEFVLRSEAIHGARGVRVVAINPRRVRVTLDHESERAVPVKGRVTGQPLLGQVESVTCEPAQVVIRGPAARLRTTDAVYTQPVDVEGRVESFVRRTPVLQPGDNWTAEIIPKEVQVRVVIAGTAARRELSALPVAALVAADRAWNVSLDPARVDVVLSGPAADLEAIDPAAVRVFVDCAGMTAPGSETLPVHVHLRPARNVTARPQPETVRVTVQPR